MKTKLLKTLALGAMMLVPVGAVADEWSYDFYGYCNSTNDPKNVSEGSANRVTPTISETAFTANGIALYNIATPATVNANFGIDGNIHFKYSNVWSSGGSNVSIGLLSTDDNARLGFKGLTIGQTITIVANGEPTIETGGDGAIVESKSTYSWTSTTTYGGKSRILNNWNTYVYTVIANGNQAFTIPNEKTVFSVSVADGITGYYLYPTRYWNLATLVVPYCDATSDVEDGVMWYGTSTASSGNALKSISDQELTYYADAAAKTAGTTTKYAPTEGLYFTFPSNSNNLVIQSDGLKMNRENVTIKIKNLKKGQKLEVSSVGAADNRYPSVKTNLTEVSTWERANAKTQQSYEAYVTADGDIEFGAVSKSNFTIKSIKIYDPQYGLAVQSIKWASLYLPFDAKIPTGAKAYYARSTTSSAISLSEIATSIPANTGVVINAESGVYNFALASTTPDALGHTNLLEGVTEATELTDKANYVLAGSENDNTTPLFKLYSSGSGTISLAAYKAYLPVSNVPNAGNARSISFSFDDGEITSIADVRGKKENVRSYFCNLAGQRVAQPTKGLYIVNGKKVIVK